MQTIQMLDEETINQIAAGEVIEDSASCIKELIENALDAGATLITLETRKAGLEWLSLSDNGHGMSQESMPIALLRHATSKLRKAEDLWSLKTLGFRGEALAAIASISKMKITSCLLGEHIAHQIEVEKGTIQSKKRVARGVGTTIVVDSLFYNTPARAAFQKGVGAQTQKIKLLLTHLALFKENIGFEWSADGKKLFSIASHTTIKERIALLLGEAFALDLLSVDHSVGTYRIEGFLGTLSSHRPARTHQHFYINGRTIQSKELSGALTRAYGTRIPEGRFPSVVCNLILPPEVIDVNVHPQKKEIRFKDLSSIERLFTQTLHKLFPVKEAPKIAFSFPTFTPMKVAKEETLPEKLRAPERQPLPIALHIHKVWGMYALIEVEQLYLVDLGRASHFLFHHEVLSRHAKGASFPTQKLLFPFTYHCSLQESEFLERQLELLERSGFGIRLFGHASFIIESLPPYFDEESAKETFGMLFAEKKRIGEERLFDLLSIKASRKSYTLDQADALLKALFALEGPYYLTNGKAVTFVLTKDNLQKIFL